MLSSVEHSDLTISITTSINESTNELEKKKKKKKKREVSRFSPADLAEENWQFEQHLYVVCCVALHALSISFCITNAFRVCI